MSKFRLITPLIVLMLVLAACSSGDEGSSGSPASSGGGGGGGEPGEGDGEISVTSLWGGAEGEAFQAVLWHLIVSHPDMKTHEMKWESI